MFESFQKDRTKLEMPGKTCLKTAFSASSQIDLLIDVLGTLYKRNLIKNGF
jgi:hypothetical protein